MASSRNSFISFRLRRTIIHRAEMDRRHNWLMFIRLCSIRYGLTEYLVLLATVLPPHAPRLTPHDVRGPPSMPGAELGTVLLTRTGGNMLRNAIFSGFCRSLASLVFVVILYSVSTYVDFCLEAREMQFCKYSVNPYLIEHNLININQLWRRSISALWMMVRRNRKEINELRLEATG